MKISVITATFNCADTVRDALSSIECQSHREIEHIVIDGSSVDGTLEILKAAGDKIDVLVSEDDEGIYDALNKGIELATGEIVGILHADDVFAHQHVLARIAMEFERSPVSAIYGDLVYVDRNESNRIVRHWRAGRFRRGKLAWGWMPPHPTFFVRRSVFGAVGLFDTSYRISADYEWLLRVLCQCETDPKYIPEVLVKMRTGGASNRSLANIIVKSCEDYSALRRNRVGGVGALVWKNIGKLGQFLPAHRGRLTVD